MWQDCCKAAKQCCNEQLYTPLPMGHKGCPMTWDGFGCFRNTDVGQDADEACPSYIKLGSTSARVYKKCTKNGTWFKNKLTGKEWTNYRTCINIEGYHSLYYVGLACCLLSIIMLVPAGAIFLAFRQLRSQQRIKLHLCLFGSFLFTVIMSLLWDGLILRDRLNNPMEKTRIYENSVWCRTLYFFIRYSRATQYFWVFCEGFYLHRLMVHAFDVPRTLIGYYTFGWGIPLLPALVYAIVRGLTNNEQCWYKNAGGLEWIIYTPNLLCILANLVFLGRILQILLTQLQPQPNEPSSYRRAVKATFVLIPLFGIQFFFVLYRPAGEAYLYEIFSKAVIDLQGAIVSLIFCYGNGEVHTLLCNKIRHYTGFSRADWSSPTSTTQYTTVMQRSPKGSRDGTRTLAEKDYIVLQKVNSESQNLSPNGNTAVYN
ncbi:hypothetical protein ScPMuIL_015831 [Solemya velum]